MPRSHHDVARSKRVLYQRLVEQAGELLARELEVRQESDDAIHAMRVASRRLRSCLTTFSPMFKRRPGEHLAGELKWLSGVLGLARDAGVLVGRFDESFQELGASVTATDARSHLAPYLDQRKKIARDEMISTLQSQRYADLLSELDQFAKDPPFAKRHLSSKQLIGCVEREIKRTRRQIDAGRRAVLGLTCDACLRSRYARS